MSERVSEKERGEKGVGGRKESVENSVAAN